MARPSLPQFDPDYDYYKMRQLVDELNRWIDTVESGESGAGGGGGGPGGEHNDLTGRDAADTHPISSISNLNSSLNTLQSQITTNANNIASNTAAIAALPETLAELNDVDLTGQSQGDLLFNVDGVNWEDTAGDLRIDVGLFEFQSNFSIVANAGVFLRNANGDVFIDNNLLGGGQYQYSVNLGNDAIRIRDDGLALFGMSGGTQNTTLQSGAEVDIVRNGVDQIALSLAPAAGGLSVNNALTGGGLERVLTESDLLDIDLQDTYDNGIGPPHIVVSAAEGPLTVRNAATPLDPFFVLEDNAGANLFEASNSALTVNADVLTTADETYEIGSLSYRFNNFYGRAGTFVGGSGGGIARVGSSSYSVFAGRSAGQGSNTLEMGSISTTRPPVALFATSYAIGPYSTAVVSHGGGNAFMTGSAAAYGDYVQYSSTSTLKSSAGAFASFTGGYAFSYRYCSGLTTIYNQGKGSFMWGYLRNLGAGTHEMTTAPNAAGSFIHGRTIGYGSAYIYANNAARGSFTQGYITGVDTAIGRISTRSTGSFAQGAVNASTAAYVAEIYSSGQGSFAQGFAEAQGYIRSSNQGSFAQGTVTGTYTGSIRATSRGSFAQGRAHNGGVILSQSNGSFAQGHAIGNGSLISAASPGALARGLARGGYAITASAVGAHAMGDTTLAGPSILATAANAFQLGPGTNSDASSLQVLGAVQLFGLTGRIRFDGIFNASTTTITATSYTAADDHVILVDDDTAGSTVTITLPTAVGNDGYIYHVKKLGTTADVVVDGDGTETIDGALTQTLVTQYDSLMVVSDGANWNIL